ncbi:hypothetical protein QTP86_008942 [Hemibagrus guttatus]|nr:hypothetical protein QTP86_008942 [Hemibagrus guttatus]
MGLMGAGGNWATVGRRSRGGRRVHRQREKRKGKSVGLRIGTLNVGTMTEKDLEKAYDRVPREELWYCMRKSGVAEKYVRGVQDMYERSRTVLRCAVGQTEEFKVEVGLHQGSALSPFLFAIVMDQLSEENPSSLQVTNLPIYQSGKGYKAISKALGLPRTTVRAIIYK